MNVFTSLSSSRREENEEEKGKKSRISLEKDNNNFF